MTGSSALSAACLYAGLNAVILLLLVFTVIDSRRSRKILLGDSGDSHMLRLMRGHGNASETIPIALILLFALALVGAPAWIVHAIGACFTAGRVLHAHHFLNAAAPLRTRVLGMLLSVIAIAAAAIATIVFSVMNL